jgi:hypothetical protein
MLMLMLMVMRMRVQYFSTEGWTYTGQWSDGQMSGVGKRIDATQGSSYVGGFADGTRDGAGTFSWSVVAESTSSGSTAVPSGGSLTCRWEDGEPVGPVEISLSSGISVRGNLQDGVWDGEVVTTDENGAQTVDIFEDGAWSDGVGNFVHALEAMMTVASMLESW